MTCQNRTVSYDLVVYAPVALDVSDLRRLVSEVSSLDLGGEDTEKSMVSVLRGAKRSYCFTVDGPWLVEPEDVPPEVTASLLEATKLYNIMVEGSRDADIPYAVRFARRLAERLGGAVLDQQTGLVWSKGASRTVEKPLRDSRVRVVTVDWYSLRSDLDDNVGHEYVIRCHRYLPEALPRRFGEFEPFQHKLGEVGEAGFARAWREAESLLFFSASAPCIAGALWAGPSEKHPRPVWHMSLELHCLPLTDRRWRDALMRLFISLAEHLKAFYASAQVTRDNIWNGRGLWSDGSTERPIQTADQWVDGFTALPGLVVLVRPAISRPRFAAPGRVQHHGLSGRSLLLPWR